MAAGRQSFLRPPCCRADQDPLALHLDQDHYGDHRGSRNLHLVLQHPHHCYHPERERENETNSLRPNQHKQRTFHGTYSPLKQWASICSDCWKVAYCPTHIYTLHKIWQLNYDVENQTNLNASHFNAGLLQINRSTPIREITLVCKLLSCQS